MQQRALWKVIVFGIITLGIYDLVWLYKTRKEMVARGQSIPAFWLLFAPILALLGVAILQFMTRFVFSTVEGGSGGGPLVTIINILSILLGMLVIFAFIPVAIWWMYKYCKAVEGVTSGQVTFSFAFGLWLLLSFFSVGFVWPALIQDGFNKISSDSGTTPPPVDNFSAQPPQGQGTPPFDSTPPQTPPAPPVPPQSNA